MFAARAALPATHEQAPANGIPDHVSRSFSPLGLEGILILDLGNGISGFAKSNQHSLWRDEYFLRHFS
jgi:hypothetical protein